MQRFKQVIIWGGIPVSFLLNIAGTYFDAKDIIALGLPPWFWYLIGLFILSASFTTIIVGFYRENKALKSILGKGSDSNIKQMEWRQDYRKPQSLKVANIPPTLALMWGLVQNIMEGNKKKRISKKSLLKMIVGLLQVPKDDPILNVTNFTDEQKIHKLTKRVGAKMGLRKSDIKLESEWRKRIAEEMDNCGIGLGLHKSADYTGLLKQLNEDRMPITRTKVDHAIDGFIENLYTLYSIKLLMFYGGTEKRLYIFSRKMRDVLKHLDEIVDKTMRGFLRQVNATLEEYSIGKDLSEKE